MKVDILAAKVIPIEDIALRLGLDVNRGVMRCVSRTHIDKNPSMKVWRAKNKFKCQPCGLCVDAIDLVNIVMGFTSIVQEACEWITGDVSLKSLTPVYIEPDEDGTRFTKPPIPTVFFERYHALLDNSQDWLAFKGINAGKYGIRKVTPEAVRFIPVFKPHGLFIPYYQNGHITYGRWRNLTNNGDRYYAMPGLEVRLYNQDVLAKLDGKKPLYLTEGETDTLSFDELGFIALGFPGASQFALIKKQLIPWLQVLTTKVPKIILAFDDDEAGRGLNERVRKDLKEAGIIIPIEDFDLQGHNDVNDWYLDII